jgi:uncharacterized protein
MELYGLIPDLTALQWGLLLLAAFCAGAVDAMVGGGGLIQVPAMFSLFPSVMPATLLGTGKVSGLFGTASAAWRYSRGISIPWSSALPAAITAFFFAMLGAYTVTHISPMVLRPLLPVMLLSVLIYTLCRPDFGSIHAPAHTGWPERLLALGIGAAIGFYDGFFGPGTGSFLIFLFIRFFGFNFLISSAVAKIVNVACNFAALLWFARSGHVWWVVGLTMACFNVAGSQVGSRWALKHGIGLVKPLFIVVVSLLTLKTGYDAYRLF